MALSNYSLLFSFFLRSHLVTSSGDGTVKIWEFAQAKCTHTFFDHTQAVWGCEIHYGMLWFSLNCSNDFLSQCSSSFGQILRIVHLIILSYLILSYLILSYLILSYLILSNLILSFLILSYLILSYLIFSCSP